MARPSIDIVTALLNTASKIEKSNNYQWGHMGLCNCGFLTQEITKQRKEEIHGKAMQRHGDWNEQLNDYCPTSGLPMDDLISEMLEFGFDTDDLKHLEKLSFPAILHSFPIEERDLRHNLKTDVVKYLRRWAELMEIQLLKEIDLPEFAENLLIDLMENKKVHNL